jgi:mannose-6-phosphate isomerase-like protein (cupin superfamily)
MLSFLRTTTPRTPTASQNPIFYEDGRASQHFHSPSEPYMVTDTIPATTLAHGRSFFNPPPHFHMYQTEEFHVVSGTARFFLNGSSHDYNAGEIIHIPIGAYHCFENASTTGEDLVIEFRLDVQDWVMEERFFRNFFGYLDDVRKAGQQPSIHQLFRFLYSVNGPLAVPVPSAKSNWISRLVSWLVMVVAGVLIGEWMLGYKGTYPEYYIGDKEKDK